MERKYFFLLLAILFTFLIGCNHKVVSFFFDGVPNPSDTIHLATHDTVNLPDSINSSEKAMIVSRQVIYFHAPYKNKKCKICHDDPSSPVKLLQGQPELCYNCHDDFNTQYRFLHGPVGGGQCSSCHSPHQSENPKLLLRIGQALCLYCHDSRNILDNEKHKEIGSADCQECHNPHGSNQKYLLK
jgi:predicted CXXCH cytochrome family protein